MNTYNRYRSDFAEKSNKAILGRKKAIWNRIKKLPNWEQLLERGHFEEPLEAIRALDDLLTARALQQQTEKENK